MPQVNDQGQITIPPNLQEQLGLLPGTEVEFEVVGDSLQLRKRSTPDRGALLVASMRGRATSSLRTDEMMSMTRESK